MAKMTEQQRMCLEVLHGAAGAEMTMLLIASKAGRLSRENLEKQGASADFIAEYERMEASAFKADDAFGEAWLLGFRKKPPPKGTPGL